MLLAGGLAWFCLEDGGLALAFMTTLSNPFHVLGLTEDATPDDVRRAYRRLALKYHPDRNGSDPIARERFLAVKQAFEQLDTKDPDAGYDTERVVAQMQKAAEEAERRRSRRGEGGRGWQLIRIPLLQPREERIREVLTSMDAVVGVVAALTAGIAVGLSGVVTEWGAPMWAPPLVAVVLGAYAIRRAFRVVVNEAWAVETHWQGLRDLRWNVVLTWEEITDLTPGDEVLDLVLSPRAIGRLSAHLPAEAFAGPTVYRLPIREPGRAASLIRPQLTA